MEILTRQLGRHELAAYAAHLVALQAEDRRLRFGRTIDDAAIRGYVGRIDVDRDAVFAVTDDELALVGAAHLARGPRCAELGISVLPAHRRRGVGDALMRRAVLHARNWGIPEFFTHCLRENAPLVRLARRNGLRVAVEGGEADGVLALPAPDASSLAIELVADRAGRFDHDIKTQARVLRRLTAAWLG
jgi:GNAT superfamily N-acetyltransferase